MKYAHSLVNGLSVPEGSKIRDWLSACSYQTDSTDSCKQLQANNFKTNQMQSLIIVDEEKFYITKKGGIFVQKH